MNNHWQLCVQMLRRLLWWFVSTGHNQETDTVRNHKNKGVVLRGHVFPRDVGIEIGKWKLTLNNGILQVWPGHHRHS